MRTIAQIEVSPGGPPRGGLWVDVLVDPPALAVRRYDAGLVHVQLAEVADLIQALALAALELRAIEADDND